MIDDFRALLAPLGDRGVLRASAFYGLAALFVIVVGRLAATAGWIPERWMPVLVFVAVAGYPVALALAWIRATAVGDETAGRVAASEPELEPAAGRVARAFGIAGLGAVVLGAFVGLRVGSYGQAASDHAAAALEPRLVVLPLIDLDRQGSPYFAEGVTSELVAGLAAVEGIEVRARASASTFDDVNRDAASIGARLGGAVVLDGTIRRTGERVRLTARLIDVASGAVAWSISRDTVLSALFEVRDDVVEGVAASFGLDVADATARRLRRRSTSPEALDLYMLGRFRWAAGEGGDLLEAAAYYQRAIEADSGFAPAWTALADAFATLPRFTRFPPERARTDAAAAARTALGLDPDDPATHTVLGEILYLYARDWAGARSHLGRAAELDPGAAAPHVGLCELHLYLGELAAARSACEAARRRDPLAFRRAWLEADIDRAAGDTMAALVRLDSLARAYPAYVPLAADLALTRLSLRDTSEALAIDLSIWFEMLGDTASLGRVLAGELPAPGRPASASPAARRALTRVEVDLDPAPGRLAALLSLYGEQERAAAIVSAALANRAPGALGLGVLPEYAALRERDDIRRLLAQAGLPTGAGGR